MPQSLPAIIPGDEREELMERTLLPGERLMGEASPYILYGILYGSHASYATAETRS